jgi:hypothetical protein
MKKFLLPLFLLALTSCANLHLDPSPGAIASNYPTAEFTACGKLWHGMGGCGVLPGEDVSQVVGLSVQGYYDGTIVADGEACGVSLNQSYVKNASVEIPIGALTQSCIITFTVTPTYPTHTQVPISGYRGYLLVRLLPAGTDTLSWTFQDFNVTGASWQRNWVLSVGVNGGPVSIEATGCGTNYSVSNVALDESGDTELPVNLIAVPNPNPCVAEGFVVSPVFKNLYFDAFVASYATGFTPLPIPTYTLNSDKITLTADPAVGVVSIDSNWTENNTGTFNFDPTVAHVARALTSMGRSVLGAWNPTTQEFTWLQ